MSQEQEMDWCLGRLQQLRGEYAAGEGQLTDLERRRGDVRDQLLRIEGAIRVLEEQLASAPIQAPVQAPVQASRAADPATG